MGGNQKAVDFFRSQSGYRDGMSIKDKYNSHFAALYKEKLLCDVEGRTFDATSVPLPATSTQSKSASSSDLNSNTSNSQSNSWPANGGGAYIHDKSQTESFFARKIVENSSRSDNLPPNQGGKYGGFGSSVASNSESTRSQSSSSAVGGADELVDNLSKWGSMFAGYVTQGVKVAAQVGTQLGQKIEESVIKPATEAVRDGSLSDKVYTSVVGFGMTIQTTTQKAVEAVVATGDRGWNEFNAYNQRNPPPSSADNEFSPSGLVQDSYISQTSNTWSRPTTNGPSWTAPSPPSLYQPNTDGLIYSAPNFSSSSPHLPMPYSTTAATTGAWSGTAATSVSATATGGGWDAEPWSPTGPETPPTNNTSALQPQPPAHNAPSDLMNWDAPIVAAPLQPSPSTTTTTTTSTSTSTTTTPAPPRNSGDGWDSEW